MPRFSVEIPLKRRHPALYFVQIHVSHMPKRGPWSATKAQACATLRPPTYNAQPGSSFQTSRLLGRERTHHLSPPEAAASQGFCAQVWNPFDHSCAARGVRSHPGRVSVAPFFVRCGVVCPPSLHFCASPLCPPGWNGDVRTNIICRSPLPFGMDGCVPLSDAGARHLSLLCFFFLLPKHEEVGMRRAEPAQLVRCPERVAAQRSFVPASASACIQRGTTHDPWICKGQQKKALVGPTDFRTWMGLLRSS
ncbi:hypothetical protein MAPG_02110 [Magnaporthiopsis poae ATCC 64411]|uniref:Uncharacterized protein n=1 Tax=Magnaporthiopsis poae (strain ATCC 64411 / 73-15) TaxID=644358 RepID=A0A0C4DQH0_MAGP6|nr:hypothetical protein MAPG_02110 [Magnaporthiopsis poae ATCC 64411]